MNKFLKIFFQITCIFKSEKTESRSNKISFPQNSSLYKCLVISIQNVSKKVDQ
jgi:hypothetical protein